MKRAPNDPWTYVFMATTLAALTAGALVLGSHALPPSAVPVVVCPDVPEARLGHQGPPRFAALGFGEGQP